MKFFRTFTADMIIPTHKITDHAESGISIRRLTPDVMMPADRPLHRDDYFAFCLLTKGELRINVDFNEHTLLGGHIGCEDTNKIPLQSEVGLFLMIIYRI